MNTLIIGSGKRVKETVLPALLALSDSFEITKIVSKRSKELIVADNKFYVGEFKNLTSNDIQKAQLIILAVTVTSNPLVLRKLSNFYTKDKILLIDTPVINPKHIFALKYLKNFSRVIAAEDNISLPPLVLAKKLIQENNYSVKKIVYNKFGYRYHALAGLKFLLNSQVSYITSENIDGVHKLRKVHFLNGTVAKIYEPRNYNDCSFEIHTNDGLITDKINSEYAVKHKLGYLQNTNGIFYGMTLDGKKTSLGKLDARYQDYIDSLAPTSQLDLMTGMKLRGYLELLNECRDGKSDYCYDAVNAFTDNLIFSFLDKLGYYHRFFIPRNFLKWYTGTIE